MNNAKTTRRLLALLERARADRPSNGDGGWKTTSKVDLDRLYDRVIAAREGQPPTAEMVGFYREPPEDWLEG
jgi:hypothetical protein